MLKRVLIILFLLLSHLFMLGDVCDAPSGTECYSCGGAGEKQVWVDCLFCSGGVLQNGEFCHHCAGRGGESHLKTCSKCNGTGIMP